MASVPSAPKGPSAKEGGQILVRASTALFSLVTLSQFALTSLVQHFEQEGRQDPAHCSGLHLTKTCCEVCCLFCATRHASVTRSSTGRFWCVPWSRIGRSHSRIFLNLQSNQVIVKVDLRNAFNCISRDIYPGIRTSDGASDSGSVFTLPLSAS